MRGAAGNRCPYRDLPTVMSALVSGRATGRLDSRPQAGGSPHPASNTGRRQKHWVAAGRIVPLVNPELFEKYGSCTSSINFKSRTALQLENLALRHPIGVLRRSAKKRPRLTVPDRFSWARLYY